MHARRTLALAACVLGASTLATVATGTAASAAPASAAFTVQTLHFAVHTGPGGTQACDIVGDLYTPATASPTHRVPAILTTNGFGGSKADQAGIGTYFASHGYEVLSYSGLGFGGSGCKITLDDPDYDGAAASQLVSYLGGAPGIAFSDAAHATAAPALNVVVHDAKDHAGKAQQYDPRLGMIGGSYGGEVQFAAASVDPRIDTIVPFITWNDLSYSLGPNDITSANGGTVSGVTSPTPGPVKIAWGALFSADGVIQGVANAQADPTRLTPCPNFATFVCPALVTGATTGYFQPGAVGNFRHASVENYASKVTVPTLLLQGEKDTLFNLNEAVANYRALKAQGTPVKMIWQSWGHSDLTPAPGEIDLDNPDPSTQYETARIANWFAHYLGASSVGTGPNFAYFRDWVPYTGIATPAYASSSTFPIGAATQYYLSGGSKLAATKGAVTAGSQSFVTPPLGLPTSLNPVDAIGSMLPVTPQVDLPGTFASWTGPTLTSPLDVAGAPSASLRVSAPTAALSQLAGPTGQLVLFAKVEDVAPDGTATTIHGLEAPIRIANVNQSFTVTLPAIVHRFAAGHCVRLVVASGSENYRGGTLPTPVTISAGTGQTLSLPTVG